MSDPDPAHDHDDDWLDDDHIRWGDHDDFRHFDVDHYPTLDVSDFHYVLVEHHERPFVIVNHRVPRHDDPAASGRSAPAGAARAHTDRRAADHEVIGGRDSGTGAWSLRVAKENMMEPTGTHDAWIGHKAYDRDGDEIGEITDIFYDDVSGRPEWIEVKAGLFKGGRLVPLAGARMERIDDDEHLVLAYPGHQVKDAPAMDTDDDHLAVDQERELYTYYGFRWEDRTQGDFGYGEQIERFDKDYEVVGEHTEDVPVTATVEVPISTTVRLRRYQTQKQRTETRTVQVPVTETEDHVEVTDVTAKGRVGDARTR